MRMTTQYHKSRQYLVKESIRLRCRRVALARRRDSEYWPAAIAGAARQRRRQRRDADAFYYENFPYATTKLSTPFYDRLPERRVFSCL